MTPIDLLQQPPQLEQPDIDPKERAGVILDAVKAYEGNSKVQLAVSRNISDLNSRQEGLNQQFTNDEIKLYFAAIDYGYDALTQSPEAPDQQALVDMTIAHQTVFASCIPLIERYIYKRLNAHDRDDVVQEATLAIYNVIPRYTNTTNIYGLMYGVASNKLNDYFRKNASKPTLVEFEDYRSIETGRTVTMPDVAEQAISQVDENHVAAAVQQALEIHIDSPKKRESFLRQLAIVCLRNGIDITEVQGLDGMRLQNGSISFADAIRAMPPKGYSADDVAEMFDTTPGAIRVSDHRSTKSLRGMLGHLVDGEALQA